MPNRKSITFNKHCIGVLSQFSNTNLKTLTVDRGKEFAGYLELEQKLNVDVIIDGKNEGKYITNNGEDNKNQNLLIYEKTGLSNGEHSVELINNTTEYLTIHYIDVDGKLMPYNEILYTQILNIEPEKEIINLNENVTANITIDNIKEIAAEDIRIKYDFSKLQFLGLEEVDGIKVVKSEENDGELRVILASQGISNVVFMKKTLLKLNFQGIATGESLVDITKGRISDGITIERDLADEECGQAIITIEDYKDPSKDGEFTLLDLAIDGRYYGLNPEDYPQYKTDVVENGAIDDEDLLQIGQYMLENPNYTF